MPHLKKTIFSCLASATYLFSYGSVVAQPVAETQVKEAKASDATPVDLSPLEKQRQIYQQAQDLLDDDKVDDYQLIRPQIASYPLTPYVDYRAFISDIEHRTPQEVNDFEAKYKTVPFSSRLSANYLSALAKTKQWKLMSEYQTQEPKGQTYQCYYYYSQWTQGQKDLAYKGAKKLWLTGSNVSSACDNLFSEWAKAGLRDDDIVLERMLLTFKSSNSNMFSYLDDFLKSDLAKQQSQDLQSLYSKPNGVLEYSQRAKVTPFSQELTELALSRLIRTNTQQAVDVFDQVVKAQKLPQKDQASLANLASAWLMNTSNDDLAKWRDNALNQYGETSRLERRARLAIQNADWKSLDHWIDKLPESDRNTTRWQYWKGRVELSQGKDKQAKQRLTKILGQRDFYSVAAANLLGEPIRYESKVLTEKTADLSSKQDALNRVQEMIAVDKISAAKSEWRWLLWHSTENEKKALAEYATQKRWHNFAVVATIEAKMWDYTSMRFPIAHRWWFDFYSKKNGVPLITLMSLARQESALDVEARSPVGARGIMQIMPATAKHTADVYKLEYENVNELYDVQKNIEIGSSYLGGLLDDFNHNRIFAFAAYNAGPHRVKTWRARTNQTIDAYSFIEAIPFNETRGYVQNILMFETYYRNLLGQDGVFLTPDELKEKY
ncbi:transglycosylase SLT domain-containing protein [Vibrio rumoiensis]|uniref:Lytic murein transglycosylase n=1 Tax=Vibrio rumoiensis 1S-45 TaxID=1188252 RepID=A0A1E5DY80_9VIBR|nr:transglycosylase SLT domain-containing protein [Vibrio rumoiensis]OEF22567.1 lytic murein transglycosylase [Vibrio rumoiensis 1S-45]